jgi:hypothetical protein
MALPVKAIAAAATINIRLGLKKLINPLLKSDADLGNAKDATHPCGVLHGTSITPP